MNIQSPYQIESSQVVEFDIEEVTDARSVVGSSMCVVEIDIDVSAGQSDSLLFVEATDFGRSVRLLVDSGASHSIVKPGLWAPPESSGATTVKARNFEGQVRSLLCREYKVPIGVDRVFHEVVVVEWPLEQPFDGILGQYWLKLTNPCIEWVAGAISVPPAMSNQSATAAVVTTTEITKELFAPDVHSACARLDTVIRTLTRTIVMSSCQNSLDKR
ncbi:hypothetical protein PsorP6_004678 [Peronosclerospora sorghi]|uniref:Uncharacterized protein n=1 Tax=Peronosclerospora sorghi TaxID=230839 RepID=A0ACC0VL21_9STRA|nr:hypothetical protein PsorP6_004678 [Peronosclerospora sorghi]